MFDWSLYSDRRRNYANLDMQLKRILFKYAFVCAALSSVLGLPPGSAFAAVTIAETDASVLELATCLPAARAKVPVLIENQIYETKHSDCCIGDVYQPAPEVGSSLPAVVLVHGGAWTGGSKNDSDIKDIARLLVESGFVVFSINYRLIDEGGRFPHNIDDVQSAVVFLSKHASQYRVDSTRVSLLGVSAGAYLSLMVAYSPGFGRQHLRAVIAVCPATDLRQVPEALTAEYLGDKIEKGSRILKKSSPLNLAKFGIPTLIVHGTEDKVVPFEQSSRLEKALKKANVAVRLVSLNGAAHNFLLNDNSQRQLAFNEIQHYLERSLSIEDSYLN